MNTNRERVLSIIAAHGSDSSGLIAILQDVQAAYNYLSEENLTHFQGLQCGDVL